MKFGTVILCNVTKKWWKKTLKIAAKWMITSLTMSNFLQNYAKNGQKFFSKINFVTARKKIFKIFFQTRKVKITYKLNIYRLIC